MKRPDRRTVLTILGAALVWVLIGWLLISLRDLDAPGQIEQSTRLLRILCVGASLLLLVSALIIAFTLHQLADETERHQHFPPLSAPHLQSWTPHTGEAAWLFAARLRGWAAVAIAIGISIFVLGVAVSLPQARAQSTFAPAQPMPFAPSKPGVSQQSVQRPMPDALRNLRA